MELSNQHIIRAAAEINNYPVWKRGWGAVLMAKRASLGSLDRNSGFEILWGLFQFRGELLVCFMFGGGGVCVGGFLCVFVFTLT